MQFGAYEIPGSQLFIEQGSSSRTIRRNRASIAAPQVIRGRVPLRGRKYMTYGNPSNDPPDQLGNVSGTSKEALVQTLGSLHHPHPEVYLPHDVRIYMNRA